MHCVKVNWLALTLIGILVSTTFATNALSQTSQGTLPSSETVRSLFMNNWGDTLAVHYARQLNKSDPEILGPYMSALNNSADWATNQIDGATAFFGADVVGGGGANRPRQAAHHLPVERPGHRRQRSRFPAR